MSTGELILYTTEDGLTRVHLRATDGTVWLTQLEIAHLFQTTSQNITMHIKSIYQERELLEAATCKQYLQVRVEGKRKVQRELTHYNLDMILAIGYRVHSQRATIFRQWATTTLKEYLKKGFVMDDARLKEPGGLDYFDELLARIKEIRASEKRFYQKVRDLYALSVDYDAKSDQAKIFFQTSQNKMLWAVTGKTAAELLAARSSSELPNMGLTNWRGSKVRKEDVAIAKNYLTKEEITNLNRLVTMFLDYAEDQTMQRIVMHMRDWNENIDGFLTFNKRKVLSHAGTISHEQAEQIVHDHYEILNNKRALLEFELSEKEALEELMQIEATLIDD